MILLVATTDSSLLVPARRCCGAACRLLCFHSLSVDAARSKRILSRSLIGKAASPANARRTEVRVVAASAQWHAGRARRWSSPPQISSALREGRGGPDDRDRCWH